MDLPDNIGLHIKQGFDFDSNLRFKYCRFINTSSLHMLHLICILVSVLLSLFILLTYSILLGSLLINLLIIVFLYDYILLFIISSSDK